MPPSKPKQSEIKVVRTSPEGIALITNGTVTVMVNLAPRR